MSDFMHVGNSAPGAEALQHNPSSCAPSECAGDGDHVPHACELTADGVCGTQECDSHAERSDGQGQPCPTPLQWQQVLENFREQSRPFRVERAGRGISGRVFGEGEPLYFLNGIGGTHELFALAAWLLRESYRCVLFDYAPPVAAGGVGAGGSIPRRLACLANDLFAVADHHGDEKFSVYATSFGSMVAIAAMAAAPERVERAVLQGGFARLQLSPFERLASGVGRWLPGRVRHVPLRQTIQQQSHQPWFPPFDQTRYQFFSENTGSVPVAEVAQRAAALSGTDLRPVLSAVTLPVLLIRSEGEGRVSAAAYEELKAGLPHARSEWMFGCGHLPYLTHPHRLVKLITPFLCGEAPVPPEPERFAIAPIR